MNTGDGDRQQKRTEVLDRLRMHFGEERQEALSDLDGLEILSTFIQRTPDAQAPEDADETLTREEFQALRRRRRQRAKQRKAGSAQSDGQPIADTASAAPRTTAETEAMTFGAMIDELPRMRANLGEWLAGVDADYLPGSSDLDELRGLYERAEYRLKVLKVMVKQTQSELDALILAIRAAEAPEAD
jgi:hypothetical protein